MEAPRRRVVFIPPALPRALLLACLVAGAPVAGAAEAGARSYHLPPGVEEIPGDKYGEDVRLGFRIFTETYRYARRYSGNGLTCASCHLDAGRRPHAAPLWAAFGMYPAYRVRNDRNNTLAERVQQCFRFGLNGTAPALDAPELRALVSYIHFLSKGTPAGVELPGRGFPEVVRAGFDPNPARGAATYRNRCAVCHGNDGAGRKREGGGYTAPPVWGSDSYNRGSGFARTPLLAGFVKVHEPPDAASRLTEQEALDVAAYLNQQLRSGDPAKGLLKGLFE
jgi:thiosulfate dehydrogenase